MLSAIALFWFKRLKISACRERDGVKKFLHGKSVLRIMPRIIFLFRK